MTSDGKAELACARIGIIAGRTHLTTDQLRDAVDQAHLTDRVDDVELEEYDASQRFEWGRIQFLTRDDALGFAALINQPHRTTQWRQFITQLLPLPDPMEGCVSGDPVRQPCLVNPIDTVVVDTQEGYVAFATSELYMTKGLEDCLQAKQSGRCIRRVVCKHFDPVRNIICSFGAQCTFLHVKAEYIGRLLRTVPHHQQLRQLKSDDDVQLSIFEHSRRNTTLIVRDLADGVKQQELEYMFGGCDGFV